MRRSWSICECGPADGQIGTNCVSESSLRITVLITLVAADVADDEAAGAAFSNAFFSKSVPVPGVRGMLSSVCRAENRSLQISIPIIKYVYYDHGIGKSQRQTHISHEQPFVILWDFACKLRSKTKVYASPGAGNIWEISMMHTWSTIRLDCINAVFPPRIVVPKKICLNTHVMNYSVQCISSTHKFE